MQLTTIFFDSDEINCVGSVRVLSRFSGFPQYKNMHVRLIKNTICISSYQTQSLFFLLSSHACFGSTSIMLQYEIYLFFNFVDILWIMKHFWLAKLSEK